MKKRTLSTTKWKIRTLSKRREKQSKMMTMQILVSKILLRKMMNKKMRKSNKNMLTNLMTV